MEKETYETPEIEVIEFDLKDHIASSADTGAGVIGTEGLFD